MRRLRQWRPMPELHARAVGKDALGEEAAPLGRVAEVAGLDAPSPRGPRAPRGRRGARARARARVRARARGAKK